PARGVRGALGPGNGRWTAAAPSSGIFASESARLAAVRGERRPLARARAERRRKSGGEKAPARQVSDAPRARRPRRRARPCSAPAAAQSRVRKPASGDSPTISRALPAARRHAKGRYTIALAPFIFGLTGALVKGVSWDWAIEPSASASASRGSSTGA